MNTQFALDTDSTKIIEDTPFVQFWNDVLADKFIRYKHILVDGLSHHSAAVFQGYRELDVGLAGQVCREAGAPAAKQQRTIAQALTEPPQQHVKFDNGLSMNSSS